MAASEKQLLAKAQGIISALEQMIPREREMDPTASFADDYNTLRGLVVEARADLAVVLPPAVPIDTDLQGKRVCMARYVEIQAYCKQIVDLLGPQG